VCVTLAALYGVWRVAPAQAAAEEPDAVASGVRGALGSVGAVLLFLPRVLLWAPTWRVAGLWAIAGGECCLGRGGVQPCFKANKLARQQAAALPHIPPLCLRDLHHVSQHAKLLPGCSALGHATHTNTVTTSHALPMPLAPSCTGAACAALRSADHAQQARGRPDIVPSDAYVVVLIAAWHPLLWWACGGRWGAVLGGWVCE